eukprot:726727-Rhodomonas_salina.3
MQLASLPFSPAFSFSPSLPFFISLARLLALSLSLSLCSSHFTNAELRLWIVETQLEKARAELQSRGCETDSSGVDNARTEEDEDKRFLVEHSEM